jgi:protein-S-isoprenylcysteine O-methyltransferase Ste14
MVVEKIVNEIVDASGKSRSSLYKSVASVLGASMFLVVVPLLLLLASFGIEEYLRTHSFRIVQITIGIFSLAFGFFLLIWSAVSLFGPGKGTPVPLAPTRKLIVDGPFRICRNPMLFGATIYYFALGTLFVSIATGLIVFFLSLILGAGYNKFIEEKELEARFGEEYGEYKRRTPFLIPRF